MDEFLSAQQSEDETLKIEKWKELVRLMKKDEPQHTRSRSKSSSVGSRDEILGFVRVNANDSISSGLTSPSSSPAGSPIKESRMATTPGSRDGGSIGTFPSLPGQSLETLPTFPSLPGKESTWDSLFLSSQEDEIQDGGSTLLENSPVRSNSIVKNLVGRYETSINKSLKEHPHLQKETGFYPRTYPMNKKEGVGRHRLQPRVVSASPEAEGAAVTAAAAIVTPQKEVKETTAPSSSAHKRKPRRENSLEEQVRNVLEQQKSHTVDNHDLHRRSLSLSASSLPHKTNERKQTSSVASAQDILDELRRSTTPPSTAVLPRSISVGSGHSLSPSPRWNSPESMTRGTSKIRSSSPAALKPSKRDNMPRPNRLNRRCVSENAVDTSGDVSFGSRGSEKMELEKGGSPLTTGENTSAADSKTQRQLNSIFPCTSPLTIGSDERSSKNTKLSEPSTNKPLASLPPSKRDVPTVSSARRSLPSVKEIAARFGGQKKNRRPSSSHPPTPPRPSKNTSPRSIASVESKDRIDEIRASINQLKNDGVGGIGKATSTLVRNQETGRYIIRDVDDDLFDEIQLAEMMRPEVNELKVLEQDNEMVREEKTVFQMPSQNSMGSSVVSDGVVDDAVRAAMDAVSSTSTDDFMNGIRSGEDGNEEDFFVISKSVNQWSSFQSPALKGRHESVADDAFEIDPCNDWNDSGSDEWRDEKDSPGGLALLGSGPKNKKTNAFPSPTSVMLGSERKLMRNERLKSREVVSSWNPFDM